MALCFTSHSSMKSFQTSLMSYDEQQKKTTLSTSTGSYVSDITTLPNSYTINFLFHVFPPSLNSVSKGQEHFTLCLCIPLPSTTVPCGC